MLSRFRDVYLPRALPTGNESSGQELEYDRAKEVKEFENTKAGVKGLVDSGIVSVPRLFLQHVEEPTRELPEESWDRNGRVRIPVIDLAGLEVEAVDGST
ncbi:1-aminocyclopropane-1-carboxylate oxidase-like protein [Drosera capensis]